jgi:predicted RNase H-like nuclease (RuvC/YqgF family)
MLRDLEKKFKDPKYIDKIHRSYEKMQMERRQLAIEEEIFHLGKKTDELKEKQRELKKQTDELLDKQYQLTQEYDDIQYKLRHKLYGKKNGFNDITR